MARAYLKTWYVELGCLAASFLALRSRAMQSLSARCSLMHLSDAPEFFFRHVKNSAICTAHSCFLFPVLEHRLPSSFRSCCLVTFFAFSLGSYFFPPEAPIVLLTESVLFACARPCCLRGEVRRCPSFRPARTQRVLHTECCVRRFPYVDDVFWWAKAES